MRGGGDGPALLSQCSLAPVSWCHAGLDSPITSDDPVPSGCLPRSPAVAGTTLGASLEGWSPLPLGLTHGWKWDLNRGQGEEPLATPSRNED